VLQLFPQKRFVEQSSIILKRLKGGTFIKAHKEFVIEGLGGENYINRIKNLEKLKNF